MTFRTRSLHLTGLLALLVPLASVSPGVSPPEAAAQTACTTLASGLRFNDAGNQSSGFALAKVVIDATAVYWFDFDFTAGLTGGAIRSVPKAGGTVITLASGLGGVNDFAVDATAVYWTEFDIGSGSGSVKKVPKNGGSATVLAQGLPVGSPFNVFFPVGIALDDQFVYWAESTGGGAIRRVSKSGGSVVDIGRGQISDSFSNLPVSIALDATFIYMVEGSGSGNPTGRARRIPIAGGTVEVLATGLENAFSPVVDADSLYWVELAAPGRIAKVPKSGGPVTVLDSAPSNPHSLAVGGGFVYYPKGGGGPDNGVRRVPTGGGASALVANCALTNPAPGEAFVPSHVAVDSTSVYISNRDAQSNLGRILRFDLASSPTSVVASVLPTSRSVQVGVPATAFATIINSGSVAGLSCSIAPGQTLPATFTYRTTDPATNQVTGTADTPVSIPAGNSQSFVFAFTPTAAMAPTDVSLTFSCANASPAAVTPGLNTLLLSASATPIPDVVALAATTSGDGILAIASVSSSAAFAVATVNVGAGDSITVSPSAGSLPLQLAVCETNPATGACLSAPASTVTTTIGATATPTFSIFATASGAIEFLPATNRIRVNFQDAGGVVRGSTGVAVRTP